MPRALLTAMALSLVFAPTPSAAEPTGPIATTGTPVSAERPYWQQRGCAYRHRSQVARNKIRRLLVNQTPFTRAEGRRVRHLTYCVDTRKKALAGERLVRKLRSWRRTHVCTAARGNRELGRCMALRDHGWGADQFGCLDELWGRAEGSWNHLVWNHAGSGAYGIPQALPASKMRSHGADYMTNPATQIAWGLDYIAGRYGTPCGALSARYAKGWY